MLSESKSNDSLNIEKKKKYEEMMMQYYQEMAEVMNEEGKEIEAIECNYQAL